MNPPSTPKPRRQFGPAASHDPLTILGERYWPTYVRAVHDDGTVSYRPMGPPSP